MPSARGFINALNSATEQFESESTTGDQRTSLASMPCVLDLGEITAISRTDPPPPYFDTQGSTPRAMLQVLTDGTPELVTATSDEAERLRNFLLHCLATDYEIPLVPKLSPADTTYFLRLGQCVMDIMSINDWDADTCGVTEQMYYFLERFIIEPARVLEIPLRLVTSMIRTFRIAISSRREYAGAWDKTDCARTMAEKLVIDRDVVIGAVVPATWPFLRVELLRALEKTQEEYFASLTDQDTYTLTEEGMEYWKSRTSFEKKFKHKFGNLPPRSCHSKISETVGMIKLLSSFSRKRNSCFRKLSRRLVKIWEETNTYDQNVSLDTPEATLRKSRATYERCAA